nr:uncharacterized protein LOC109766428 [Aegilops tauschii subsp. strangulata]
MLCMPTISNVAVTKTLIGGGAGLNVLSVEAFSLLHVPLGRLRHTKPLSRVGDGSISPLGQIRLPVTFRTHDNYHTELIDFNITRIGLLYNAILGYPAQAKFVAATHPTYNIMKMSESSGVLAMAGDTKEALMALRLTFRAEVAARPTDEAASGAQGAAPAKKKKLFSQDQAKTKKVSVDEDGALGATFTIGTDLTPDQEEALVKFLHTNKEAFAWEPKQLVHPVKQKARR